MSNQTPYDLLVSWERILLSNRDGHLYHIAHLVKKGDLEKIISLHQELLNWKDDWDSLQEAFKSMLSCSRSYV